MEEKRTPQNTLEPDIKIKRKSPFSRSTFVAHIHHLIKHGDHPQKKQQQQKNRTLSKCVEFPFGSLYKTISRQKKKNS